MVINYSLSTNLLDSFAKSVLPISTDDLIFVPTMRAKRKLIDYLLYHNPEKTFFLPEIRSFDEADSDEDFNTETLSNERRQILMTQLIQSHFKNLSLSRAFSWAEKLLSLLDKIQVERLSLENIDSIVREDLNQHYQSTLSFLNLIKHHWPNIIQAEGKPESRPHKIKQLDQFITTLKDRKKGRIFAIGTTGSLPTTRKLLQEINKHPNGHILFQGIPAYTEEQWNEIDETHAAFGFKQTLKELETDPQTIKTIGKKSNREICIEKAFLPANHTGNWQNLEINNTHIFHGLHKIEASKIQIEALSIALAVLDQKTQKKKTLIVTSDRDLISHVQHAFSRLGLILEDSVQPALTETPLGQSFEKYITVLNEDTPQNILTLLKTESVPFDENDLNQLEIFWRTTRPESAIKESIPVFLSLTEKDKIKIQHGYDIFEKIDKKKFVFDGEEKTFADHLDLLLQNFKDLTQHATTAFDTLFEDIKSSGEDWVISAKDFLKVLPTFLQKLSIKKTFNTEADALVLGPIEARMQEADLIILSGLNENNFPRPTQDDPILNEAMRIAIGLPSLSRKIGLMALDFASIFSKENVLLTRTTTNGGSPTQPSRFIERIEALLGSKMPESPYLEQAIVLDTGKTDITQTIASFNPPIESRPNKLSASSVEMWMRDPYAFYAKYILKLYAPDDFETKKESLLFGNIIHDALENLAKLNTWSEKEILSALQKGIQPLHLSISQKLFWIKKAEKIARFLSAYETDLPPHKKFIEIWGEIVLSEKIKLTAKADRIQTYDDGTFEIIDYKTGALPSVKEMISGLSPQLPLEALIAERGGFKEITGITKALTYLRLGQGKKASDDGLIASFKKDLDLIKEKTHQNLAKLCLKAEDKEYAYTANREHAKEKYMEYRHLERLTEE